MSSVSDQRSGPRVLHVNDSAFTTTVLLAEARRRGLSWSYQPIAVSDPEWHGPVGRARRAARGARWAVGLGRRALRADLLHVHGATVANHTSWVRRPYVLHLHGTDIRTLQYDRRYAAIVARALDGAVTVLYSTPDLRAHARRRRADATLFPVPIDVDSLPHKSPPATPTVFFTSRWEPVKGLSVQLAVAAELRRRHGGGLSMIGIDWGIGAPAARELSVVLLPRSTHGEFLRLVAASTVAVGQPTGMVAASELEAVGIGVPVVAALRPDWYGPDDGPAPPPVFGGLDTGRRHELPGQDAAWSPRAEPSGRIRELAAALADEVDGVLADPDAASAQADGRCWLLANHGAAVAVDRLQAIYGHDVA